MPDHLSTVGINLLMKGVDTIAARIKDHAKLIGESVTAPTAAGIVFVKVLRQQLTRVHSETMAKVIKTYPDLVFSDHTTELTEYQEASAAPVPVFLVGSQNAKRASDQYMRITNEFVKRLP
jgi:chromosome partitioning protein